MTTVLLVEDQLELRAIHSTYLREHGFQVLTAGDGDSALATARAETPDIILLDHSLPRRMGIDVARELHEDPRTARIPIVMVTAHAYGAVGRKARAAGCVSFLAKPCAPSRVLQEVLRFTAAAPA
jgi:two-component system alkaline phosphatase synthesis response regulator PhoP